MTDPPAAGAPGEPLDLMLRDLREIGANRGEPCGVHDRPQWTCAVCLHTLLADLAEERMYLRTAAADVVRAINGEEVDWDGQTDPWATAINDLKEERALRAAGAARPQPLEDVERLGIEVETLRTLLAAWQKRAYEAERTNPHGEMVDPALLEPYFREMRERTIPNIVAAVQRRQRAAAGKTRNRPLLAAGDARRPQLPDLLAELQKLLFPIMGGPAIPWSVIALHERQAQRNHSQTLQGLASRGGLSPCEAVAVLEDREWHSMSDADARARLIQLAAGAPADGAGPQEK